MSISDNETRKIKHETEIIEDAIETRKDLRIAWHDIMNIDVDITTDCGLRAHTEVRVGIKGNNFYLLMLIVALDKLPKKNMFSCGVYICINYLATCKMYANVDLSAKFI